MPIIYKRFPHVVKLTLATKSS